jgi:lysophospholipase L1-like esterase
LDEFAADRWEVYTRGVPGETVVQGLQRFEKDVAPLLPALVLVEFGLNDCCHLPDRRIPRTGIEEFQVHLEEIVRLVIQGGGRPVLLTNHPTAPGLREETSGLPLAEKLAYYQETIRRVAKNHRTGLLDLERGVGSSWTHLCLTKDGIHLTPEGHDIYGRVVFRELLPILKEASACNPQSLSSPRLRV